MGAAQSTPDLKVHFSTSCCNKVEKTAIKDNDETAKAISEAAKVLIESNIYQRENWFQRSFKSRKDKTQKTIDETNKILEGSESDLVQSRRPSWFQRSFKSRESKRKNKEGDTKMAEQSIGVQCTQTDPETIPHPSLQDIGCQRPLADGPIGNDTVCKSKQRI